MSTTATPTATPGDLQAKQRERREREAREREGGTIPPAPDAAGEPPLEGEAPEDQPDEVVQLSIEGDADVKHTVGGHKPGEATLIIQGGALKVTGAIKKGQRVRIVLEGPITGVHVDDVREGDTVVRTKAKHVLKPDHVERVDLTSEES